MYQRLPNGKGPLFRADSICPSPQTLLLEAVLRNDREVISRLIENNADLLTHIYTPEYNKPILLIALSEENVEAETVKTLIDRGADLYYSSEIDQDWRALHFAAAKTDSKTLEDVLNNLKKRGDINMVAKGNTALHILIKHGRNDKLEEFEECAKILIERGIDVNQGDTKCISPILWAAKKGYGRIVQIILDYSDIPVDLDSHELRGQTAREIIIEKQLHIGNLPEKIENNNESDEDILFKYLQQGPHKENAFINYKNGEIQDLVNADNGSMTLLQICCHKGLTGAAELLLEKGADPNRTKSEPSPIEIVANNGFYEIFKMLVDDDRINIPKGLLITLLKKYDNEKLPGISHADCYDYLFKKLSNKKLLNINEYDASRNPALHYAIRYATQDKIDELLDQGAFLGIKNRYGFMPVQDMSSEMLEAHLDKCVQFDISTKKDREDFCVTFNYQTLIPPAEKPNIDVGYDNKDSEANFINSTTQELVAETEVVYYMSKAHEFRHLLKHPVIVSFLYMKWHKIRWLFLTNLAFYIAFSASLVLYIFTSYANFDKTEKSSFELFIIHISWIILLVTYFVLVFRELFQITVSPEKYFVNFENYVEVILIFITGAILFISSPSEDLRKQLSSISILLAAFELVLMVGQHPKLSTNVVMLKTVSFNFFKFLSWYSLLIIAFALSFYILFTTTEPQPVNNDEHEEDFFTDPAKSMFKTIVMLTGEFDAGSINFDHFPFTSKLLFSVFIFMIAIILVNLLNGLAVSDTQTIKNDAELVGHISRAQHIHYVECMLLGNVLPTKILTKINDFCCCFPPNTDWNLILLKPLAKQACLFPHHLEYKLTFYPNKGGQIDEPPGNKKVNTYPDEKSNKCFCPCSYISVDKATVNRTMNIVRNRKEETKHKQDYIPLQKIEDLIKKLEEKTNNDRIETALLNKKIDNIIEYLIECKYNNQ